jgi:hypothetical protein
MLRVFGTQLTRVGGGGLMRALGGGHNNGTLKEKNILVGEQLAVPFRRVRIGYGTVGPKAGILGAVPELAMSYHVAKVGGLSCPSQAHLEA